MLSLADFEVVRDDAHLVCPVRVPAPRRPREPLRRPAARSSTSSRSCSGSSRAPRPRGPPARSAAAQHVSVVIPCRNEAGHIRPLVDEPAPSCPRAREFLFVEGNSTDDTAAVIQQVDRREPGAAAALPQAARQGQGRRRALRLRAGDGATCCSSSTPTWASRPGDVPKFVEALARGKGEMVNGSRLVYPMEGKAMRFLNLLANKFFAFLFSWLLGQQVRDTLCGTKALWREDYERIAANRAYFGDFDPFGDFDLLFGAARLNLRIVDLAVRYHERRYGETNISRFRHGWLLLQMSASPPASSSACGRRGRELVLRATRRRS